MKYIAYIFLLFLTLISDEIGANTDPIHNSAYHIPFEIEEGLIIMQMEVDGIVGNYILDSGSESIMINRTAGRPDALFTTVHGDRAGEKGSANIRIGNKLHLDMELWYVDLDFIVAKLNTPIAGLVGASIISQQDVMIDYDLGRIIFLDQVDFSMKVSPTRRVVVLPFETHFKNLPVIQGMIDGRDVRLGFDSGANTTVLDRRLKIDLEMGVDINLRGITIENVVSTSSHLTNLTDNKGKVLDGILSISDLQANQVVISYKNGRIVLLYDSGFTTK